MFIEPLFIAFFQTAIELEIVAVQTSSFQKLSISARNLSSRGSAVVVASALYTARESKQAPIKPRILVSEKLREAELDLLGSYRGVECLYNLSSKDLFAKIVEIVALIVRSGTKVMREVFEAAKGKLKVVGRACIIAINNVNLPAASELGCLVMNVPTATANTIAAVEHGGYKGKFN